MDQNQRPHSRNKTVGSGSAGVGRGSRVSGNGPVGFGGRKESSSGPRDFGSTGGSYRPRKRMSFKTILIIAVVIIGLVFVMKNFGGSMPSFPDISGYDNGGIEHINNANYTYTDDSYSSYSAVDKTVSPLAREKRVTPVGNGNDVVTVMVYMCGTDLESKHGMATKDIQEMLNASISDKVNIILETGGCKGWKNNTVSSQRNQIFKVETGGLKLLEKDAGNAAMTDPGNLTKFIDYCEKNYPADRNMLIFWDHGGGSLTGYGYDEKFPSSSSMTLSKINSALKAANCTFDFIGFDACLMATLETALVCNNYADYLIASEETEPGTGWYYKNWISELSANTSAATTDIAKTIIDDFVSSCRASSPSAKVTLSLTDLAELDGTIPEAFRDFSASTNKLIASDDYRLVSDARAGVRQFSAQNKLNQVDLADLADRIDTDESKALSKVIHGCVKYNQSTITRCNGLSIYFPYETTKSVGSAVASYQALGIDDEYTKCIKSFASLEYGGQIASASSQLPQTSSVSSADLLGTLINAYSGSASSTSPVDALLGGFTNGSTASAGYSIDPSMIASLLGGFSGRSMPGGYEWVDTQLIADNAKEISKNFIDPAKITATDKNGKKVLTLSDDEWGLIQTVELNVFVQDGDGYIDLGLDNTFEWDDDDDLLLDFDGTWLTLNGHTCAYYLVSDTKGADGSWTTVGRIPAKLNGELVDLQVVFDKNNPDGTVTGAFPMYEDDLVDVQAKGAIEIKAGDKIELLCDYYDLDGNFESSYTLGDSFTVPASGLKLTNLALDADNFSYTYRITDIYGNHYWTPVNN